MTLRPDVVIMDLRMPGIDGIAATRAIKEKLPDSNVLVLTLYAEDLVSQAVEAGVSGYLLKDSDSDQITKGVHQVYAGLSPIAPSLTRGLVSEFAKLSRSNRSSILTSRQIEILKLVAEGESGRQIGEKLFLSSSTVKREVRHIFVNLGVNDRAHAVSEAMKPNFARLDTAGKTRISLPLKYDPARSTSMPQGYYPFVPSSHLTLSLRPSFAASLDLTDDFDT